MKIESQYLKSTFKSGKTIIIICGRNALRLKGPVHFLQKKRHINFDIYVNQVLKTLGFLFYEQYIQEKKHMIWINNGASYYTSKINTK